jgi:hypothetical protein
MQTEENGRASRDEAELPEAITSAASSADASESSATSTSPIHVEISDSYPTEVKRDLSGGDDDPSRTHQYKLNWRPTETHVFVSVEGVKTCHIGLVRQTVKIGGASLDVAGVGGVLVRSGERGHGYGRAAMDAASSFVAREWKVGFMLLFCREALRSWYDALGWRKVLGATWAEQPSGSVVLPLESMWKALDGARWPDGDVYLQSRPW